MECKSKTSVAVVGSGYWGKNLVRNFHVLGCLSAVCDANLETLDVFSKQYPGVHLAQEYTDILADKTIHGIAIATPAVMHADMVREAILAGKDVYVEKPLCLTENEGVELNNLARDHKKILMVGHLLWYHPAVIKLKGLIDSGELGRIDYIYSNRLNLGKLRREENVLWSFAPHDVSVIIGLLDEMPESIKSQGGNFLHQKIADTTVTLLNFASGKRAHIFVSWLHPFKEQKLVVVGEKKMAVFDDTAPWEKKLQLYPHSIEWDHNIPIASKADVSYVEIVETEPLREECAHFVDCIQKRLKPRTDGEEGVRVLKVLNSCQESLENDQTVKLTEAISETDYFIHESAIVDENVKIGENTKIWHFSHIISGSEIGDNCNVGQNVVVGPNSAIGNGCKIQNNISIYDGVILEDNVFCGPSMVFTNVYNPRSEFPRKDQYRKTLVKKGATLGANCTIVGGITIGKYAFVGAGALVNKDVPDFALMVGNPAKQIGWMSRFGERLDAIGSEADEFRCPHTGETYQLQNGKLVIDLNIPNEAVS